MAADKSNPHKVVVLDGGLSTYIESIIGGPLHPTLWSAALLSSKYNATAAPGLVNRQMIAQAMRYGPAIWWAHLLVSLYVNDDV